MIDLLTRPKWQSIASDLGVFHTTIRMFSDRRSFLEAHDKQRRIT